MKKNVRNMIFYVLGFAVLFYLFVYFTDRQDPVTHEYSEIVAHFDDGEVEYFTFDMGTGELVLTTEGSTEEITYTVPNVSVFLTQVVLGKVDVLNAEGADIKYDLIAAEELPWWASMIPSLILVGGLVLLYFFVMRQQGGGGASSFGKVKVKYKAEGGKTVYFTDVAGADEEKEDLEEIVSFLKNPNKYTELGARVPKGVLLMGPPGTGKTLLARAVAGEAGVPFFSISGSNFVEMFVGVGASRVRDLFDQAKKESPSIVFIDEIDAVGRQRGAGLGGGHDEREQTLNQLLVEMDGFGVNEGVIVMAATNRKDVLDPALLRPGRFDRQIVVNYPDVAGREAILNVHARNKPFAPDVDFGVIARGTPGFTGADLENLLNEAALLSARKGLKSITSVEIQDATMKVLIGPEKKSRVIKEEEKSLTAFHEAGHAIVTYHCDTQDPVHEISIIPRGFAGGYTLSLPEHDVSYKRRREMFEEIVVLLGGRVAEKLMLDDISTGASNDLERATSIARSMITKYGFSEALGPVVYGESEQVFLGRDFTQSRNYSEGIASSIDIEVRKFIDEAYKTAKNILKDNIDKLNAVAQVLLEFEKIDGDTFKKIMEEDDTETLQNIIVKGDETAEVSEEKMEVSAETAEALSGEETAKEASEEVSVETNTDDSVEEVDKDVSQETKDSDEENS